MLRREYAKLQRRCLVRHPQVSYYTGELMFSRFVFAAAVLAAAPAAAHDHEGAESQPSSQPSSQPASQPSASNAPTEAEPVEIETAELEALVASGAVTVCDANNASVRERVGVIPGAVLLSDYEFPEGEVAMTADPVVFYCYNQQCGASHMAAWWALEAGFEDARVYKPGIVGWIEAGNEVAAYTP